MTIVESRGVTCCPDCGVQLDFTHDSKPIIGGDIEA